MQQLVGLVPMNKHGFELSGSDQLTTIITSVLHVLASTWCTSYCCVGPSHHTNWTIVLLVHCVICASSFACLDVQSV